MKVEIVSIGTELLVSDILDTNSAYISSSLREVRAQLTCRVTVGDNPDMIADVLQVALSRADVVITTGGMGYGEDDFTRHAVAKALGLELLPQPPGIAGATVLGDPQMYATGLLIEVETGVLFCLPGNRREMAYLLETELLPYLRERMVTPTCSGWLLLRTVGMMESVLKQKLADLTVGPGHRITFDTFAGQTNIHIWAESQSDELLQQELTRLKQIVQARLGDHVFGGGEDRLEEVVLNSLMQNGVKLALSECYTGGVLTRNLRHLPGAEESLTLMPVTGWQELADYLQLEPLSTDNLTLWCRTAAERLLTQSGRDLGLVVYSNVTQSGVQILVTLASPHGVSVTQRSFGGHPENIDRWAFTLGLAHLRRWLLVHYQ